jgi:hypothetical protein
LSLLAGHSREEGSVSDDQWSIELMRQRCDEAIRLWQGYEAEATAAAERWRAKFGDSPARLLERCEASLREHWRECPECGQLGSHHGGCDRGQLLADLRKELGK